MLGFMQNWFAPKANPIGVDFGSDCLRLAQVQVGLHHPWHDDRPAGVEHDVESRAGPSGVRPDGDDVLALDRDVALDDVARIVHGEDRATADQHRAHVASLGT